MAPRDRLSDGALRAQVMEQADRMEFVQAVRLLELAQPDKAAVGAGSDPTREAVSFRAKVGMEFSTSDVLGASGPDYHDRTRIEVAFMGLAGNEGPLPAPYSEMVLQRSRPPGAQYYASGAHGRPDDDARDFLDIFNHRLISYFYRGRKKHSIALGAAATEGAPLMERLLFQLIGFNEGVPLPGLREREADAPPVEPRALLRYAGMMASQQRSMAGLETMLADAFGAAVRGTEHLGRWLPVEPRFQTRIGPGGQNRVLGRQTVLGKRAWDARGKIALAIGPLALARYQALLPGGADHERLAFMVRFYLREDLDVDVTLMLAAPNSSADADARLAHLGGGASLARTTWLGAAAPGQARSARFALPRWHPRDGDEA